MRQVPVYLIIGNGRMARHMAFYLNHLGLAYRTFARKTHDFSELPSLLQHTTHILLLLRDDAIEEFIHTHLRDCEHTLVHFSGRLNTPHAIGAHPLASFGLNLYTPDIYREVWFIVEENERAFADILPGLPNSFVNVPIAAKGLYHSVCVLSGNFTCLLWQKFFNTLQHNWQIPQAAGNAYLKSIMNNILADPNMALTGPLVRHDEKTIASNLEALSGDPYQAVYQAFVEAYQQEKK